nr:hypothetical protein [Candidatus Dojkabacteria bacterium]
TFLNVKTKAEVEINTKKFDDAVDLFEKNPTLFYAKYLVRQALNVNVVQINNASVYWVGKQDNLEWYKFTSIDAFITAIYGELDKIESPILDEFILLLSKKGIVIPTALSKE